MFIWPAAIQPYWQFFTTYSKYKYTWHYFRNDNQTILPNYTTVLYDYTQQVDLSSVFSTLSGLVLHEIISTILNLLFKKLVTTLVIKFLLHLNQQIYHKIWIPYCISRSTSHPSTFNSLLNLTSHSPQPLFSNSIHSKIYSWYIQWIKYQTNLSYIITNNQI